MAGRPKLSEETHKQNGTYRKDRHEGTGIKFNPAKEIPLPEKITNEKTITTWNTIIPSLCEKGLVSIVEVPILEYAFECYQNAKLCETAIDNLGGVCAYLTQLDYKQKDLTKYQKDYMNEFNSIMFKFGITPAENPKVRQASNKKDENDVSDLLGLQGKM